MRWVLVCVVFMMSVCWGQPFSGSRLLLSIPANDITSPAYDVVENHIVRLVWTQNDRFLYTAAYDWNTEEFVDPPHEFYSHPGWWPLAGAVAAQSVDQWSVVVAESSWTDTCRIVGLTISGHEVAIDVLLSDAGVLSMSEPSGEFVTHFLIEDYVKRHTSGWVLVLKQYSVIYGYDYTDGTERRRAIYYSDDIFTQEHSVEEPQDLTADRRYFAIYDEGYALAGQDSMIFVSSLGWDIPLLHWMTPPPEDSVGTDTLACDHLWAVGLICQSSGRKIMYSSGGVFEISLDGSCSILNPAAGLWGWNTSCREDKGCVDVSGSSAGDYITLSRVDTAGNFVQLVADIPLPMDSAI